MADINIILDAAPVQAVNGKIGFVTLSPEDLGLTGLATSGDLSVVQNQIDNLDLNYASDLQLSQTGQSLQSQINNLGNTYVTKVSGQFTNRPFVNGTGVLLSGEAARLPDTIVYTSGSQIISGSKTFYADNYIFSGANVIFVQNTGIVSGAWRFLNRPTVNNTGVLLQGELDLSVYATVTNLATTGSALQSSVDTLTTNLATTGSTLANNLATTGSTLSNKIDTLSGNSVLTNGEQTIFGTKYFSNSVYIHDLYVTGTEFIANVENKFVGSPYILLNLTGGALDGGLFFVTGSGLTGVNDYGPIIGFDHSNKFKFGIARRSDDLSILNDIAAVQDLTSYSGFANTNFYTNDNPSGFITNENVVFTTGTQTISGDKTFQANEYIFSGANISIVGDSTFSVETENVSTNGIVKNFGGTSGIQVITTGEYNSITPVSGIVYILI